MKTISIIFLVSLLSLKTSALPEPEEVVIFDGKHTFRGGDVKRTRSMVCIVILSRGFLFVSSSLTSPYRDWKSSRSCNVDAIATGAGPLGSTAHLTSVNASAKTAAGPAAVADIFANPAPSLMCAWNETSDYLSGGTE
ncbi:hypothetical protein E4U19_005115 [Claviceps sp. Clav32 group G5]|nr:hypothetical protein E4U19_005115 [Claviceps sp. Clav32 group G5]KAG6049617.1 hypothetical protein E4U39_005734 [Claviceps sp. Clav50 group G5]